MRKILEDILQEFRPCFSRQATYAWFALIVFGLIIRLDHAGVTSIVRWLFLAPTCYDTLLNFVRSNAWNLPGLLAQWATISLNHYPLMECRGRKVMLGDTTKVGKEAKRMPGVKTLRQESASNSKAEYIRGHHIGFVGLAVETEHKTFCLPQQGEIHEGLQELRQEENLLGKPPTIVTRMARLAITAAKRLGCLCYLCLDACYAAGPMFLMCRAAVNEHGEQWLHVIARAKDNYAAYFPVADGEQVFIETDKVCLQELFDYPDAFVREVLTLYGERREVLYCCVDLLWKPVQGMVRFVCVSDGGSRYVLMCSDLMLAPEDIIRLYTVRWKIEVMFWQLKIYPGAFAYHFWTKLQPKAGRAGFADYGSLSAEAKAHCLQAVERVERFVNLSAIALGLMQYIAIKHSAEVWEAYAGRMRTPPSGLPSEGVVQDAFRAEFFGFNRKVPNSGTSRVMAQDTEPFEPVLAM